MSDPLTFRPDPASDPSLSTMQRMLIARGEMVETLYQKLEEVTKPRDLTQDELDRMNLCMGFAAGTKGQDYRPYCVRKGCKHMPRMFRTDKGFECWDCKGEWDLRLVCRHPHPNGNPGQMCESEEMEKTPVGYRCRRCAGMHHFTGRPKDKASVEACDLGCCGPREGVEHE